MPIPKIYATNPVRFNSRLASIIAGRESNADLVILSKDAQAKEDERSFDAILDAIVGE